MSREKPKLGIAFFWSFFEQAGSKAISLLMQILLARLLVPEDFGVLAILLVFTGVADTLAQSGLGSALIQKDKVDDVLYSTAFWLSAGISLALYVVLFVCAPFVSQFYAMPEITCYLRVIALCVLFNSIGSIQRSLLQRALNFKSIFIANLATIIISGILGVLLAWFGMGIWSLVGQSLCGSICMFVLMMYFAPLKLVWCFNRREAYELFSYGWKICLTGVLNVLYNGISELIIGKACSAASLGYYSQGRKYPMALVGVLSNSLQNVMFPALSSLRVDKRAFRDSLKKMLMAGNYVVMPFSVLLAVIAEPFIDLVLTETWLPCVPIFQFTCLSYCVLIFQLVNLRAYMALGESGLYLKLQIIKVLIGGAAICSTALIWRNVYYVAAMTFFFTVLSIVLIDMHPAKRMHGFSALEQLRGQIPVALLSLISALVSFFVSFLTSSSLLLIVFQISVFAFVFIAGSALFKVEGFFYWRSWLKNRVRNRA